MRRILFILSILFACLNAADMNFTASLAEILRNSKGEIVTDFSQKAFPIDGMHKNWL